MNNLTGDINYLQTAYCTLPHRGSETLDDARQWTMLGYIHLYSYGLQAYWHNFPSVSKLTT